MFSFRENLLEMAAVCGYTISLEFVVMQKLINRFIQLGRFFCWCFSQAKREKREKRETAKKNTDILSKWCNCRNKVQSSAMYELHCHIVWYFVELQNRANNESCVFYSVLFLSLLFLSYHLPYRASFTQQYGVIHLAPKSIPFFSIWMWCTQFSFTAIELTSNQCKFIKNSFL